MTRHDIEAERTVAEGTGQVHARTEDLCVVGLGYVGLPLAVRFAEHGHDVVGFDVDAGHVETLRSGTDTTGDLGDRAVAESGASFSADPADIAAADYVIVTVPTPLDEDDQPDLGYVGAAGETVGDHMEPGTTVVLESTVYPGATRDVFVPALETGGLTHGEEFAVGYSPERMTPGDPEHGLADTVKIVSGDDEAVCRDLADLYGTVVDAGVHRAESIEVAEAAKAVENIQRDLNIALVNELAMAFDRMDVDTRAVLEAAGTKWNFHEYTPGLVGGHCIPVDPFYFVHRAEDEGYTPELVLTGRECNEAMPDHVAELAVKGLNECGKVLRESELLVLGLSYKANVGDVRMSKVTEIAAALSDYDIDLAGYDPHVDVAEAREALDIDVQPELQPEGFDAVLAATPHREFERLDLDVLASRLAEDPLLVDVEGVFDRRAAAERMGTYKRV